jgi:hypothetical protein
MPLKTSIQAKKLKIDKEMRVYKFIILLAISVLTACSSDEPTLDLADDNSKAGEIECNIESRNSAMSRTYYESGSIPSVYYAKWDKEDQIAMCFDGDEEARRFNLLKGENSTSAVFYGQIPSTYSKVSAVYPFDIFKEQTSNSIEVVIPSKIKYNAKKILSGAMPMFAQGTAGALNFYNLMGVIKISVRGSGLLRNITISSVDGHGMSGNGSVILDENNMPRLLMKDEKGSLTINTGAMLLSMDSTNLFLPIPAITYENGLKLDFEFEGRTETRILNGTLHFERSVMRAVKPYDINVPFDFDNYKTRNNEIWYKSNVIQPLSDESDLGVSVISNSFSVNNQLGVIATESAIAKIGGPLFESPQTVTYVKLPNTIQEIAMNGLKNTSIEFFEAPKVLKTLGVDALLGCAKLKKIILNDGLESLGLDVFGDCPNLEYVFIPKTVKTIGAYSFRCSTEKLDHWDGDCPLIDNDKHALYANSAYGMTQEKPDMIDIVAGCNLTEYKLPDQAMFTQNYALSGCKKLKKLILHENFKSFGLDVFNSLNELETIVSYAITPPSFNPDEVFESKSLKEVYVPQNSIELYRNADGWKNFSDLIKAL